MMQVGTTVAKDKPGTLLARAVRAYTSRLDGARPDKLPSLPDETIATLGEVIAMLGQFGSRSSSEYVRRQVTVAEFVTRLATALENLDDDTFGAILRKAQEELREKLPIAN
jgi:hypothetical protein